MVSVLVLALLCTGCGKLTKINELTAQGNEAYKQGKYQQAIDAYNQVLELDEDRELIYNNRGMAYMETGSFAQAAADFTEAIGRNPEEDVYYNNRGLAYLGLKEYEKAETDFSEAIRLRQEASYYVSRANARKNLGDTERALEDYSAALALSPGNLKALNNRGALYFAQENYEAAIKDYTAALQQQDLTPEDELTLYWNRAEAERMLESYETAARDYQTYLEKKGEEDGEALEHLAQCQAAQQLLEEAAATYSRLLMAEPDRLSAHQGRADAYYQLEQYAEAAEDYSVLLTAEPDFINYAFRGHCYYQLGQYDQALEDLTASIELNDQYAWAYYIRSSVYKEKKEYKLARADLTKAIELEKQAEE